MSMSNKLVESLRRFYRRLRAIGSFLSDHLRELGGLINILVVGPMLFYVFLEFLVSLLAPGIQVHFVLAVLLYTMVYFLVFAYRTYKINRPSDHFLLEDPLIVAILVFPGCFLFFVFPVIPYFLLIFFWSFYLFCSYVESYSPRKNVLNLEHIKYAVDWLQNLIYSTPYGVFLRDPILGPVVQAIMICTIIGIIKKVIS